MKALESTLPIPSVIKCTQKCLEALESHNEFKGRARQYCVLLSQNAAISVARCEQLQPLIDLPKLIQEGFIEYTHGNSEDEVDEIMIDSTLSLRAPNTKKSKVSIINIKDKQLISTNSQIKYYKSALKSHLNKHSKNDVTAHKIALHSVCATEMLPLLNVAIGEFDI